MIALFCVTMVFLGFSMWLVITTPSVLVTQCDECGTKLHAVPERHGLQLNTTMILECPNCIPRGD